MTTRHPEYEEPTHGSLDDELRRVPLPAGLLERLKRIAAHGLDEELDAQLRAIEIPDGFLARLKTAVADAQLDERVARVPLPEGFAARLMATVDDAVLDEAIARVPVPIGFTDRLQSIAGPQRRVVSARRIVRAAAVAVMVSATYVSAAALLFAFLRPLPEPAQSIALAPAATLLSDDQEPLEATIVDAELTTSDPLLANLPVESSLDEVATLDDPDALAVWQQESRWPLDPNAFGQSPDPAEVLGARDTAHEIPALESVRPRGPAGVSPPRVSGFDRTFLARRGVHPFLSPSAHNQLRIALVPLTSSTASYDELRARLRGDQHFGGVVPGEIRVEDFLSAMRYDFAPPSKGALALRTAAGPSPFAKADVQLLQVGVQAARASAAPRSPVHLTIAVDRSPSMDRRGGLARIRTALLDLVNRLSGDDRLTLIAFDGSAEVLFDGYSQSNSRRMRQIISTLKPGKGANIRAGLAAACDASLREKTDLSRRRQSIVLTEGPGALDETTRDELWRMLRRAAADGMQLALVEVGRRSEPDRELARCAAAAGGKVFAADSADAMRATLVENLTGRSTVVATEAQLRVTFNPQAVASYRLVGHEPTAGLVSGPLSAELCAEQSATALFEVVLHPSGAGEVAIAEVVWRDAATGRAEQRSQRISRLQFATSLVESPISLQAAAIAAETAEILRGSYYTPAATHSLDRVREQAEHVHPALQRQPEFVELMKLVELAAQAASGR